MVSKCAK